MNNLQEASVKKTSLTIVGLIWLLVGIGLMGAGVFWLNQLSFGPKMISFIAIGAALGLIKGKFVLQKVALKYYKRSNAIQLNKGDILTGWVKILGLKGFFLISIMIALGYFLRHSNIDRPILGLIYLAVGISLVYASKIFFNKEKS